METLDWHHCIYLTGPNNKIFIRTLFDLFDFISCCVFLQKFFNRTDGEPIDNEKSTILKPLLEFCFVFNSCYTSLFGEEKVFTRTKSGPINKERSTIFE